jgi:hypothetical protein
MKIVELSDTKLTLKHRPIVNWIAGGFVAGVGILSIIFAVSTKERFSPTAILSIVAGLGVINSPVVTCTFDRTKDELNLKNRKLIGTQVTKRSLQEITDVKAISCGPYGITLVVSGEDMPIQLDQINFFGKTRTNQAIAKRLGDFLNLDPGK